MTIQNFCIIKITRADQLFHKYVAFDQCHCFATKIQSLFFLNFKPLAILYDCTTRFVLDLAGIPEDRFSHDAACNM